MRQNGQRATDADSGHHVGDDLHGGIVNVNRMHRQNVLAEQRVAVTQPLTHRLVGVQHMPFHIEHENVVGDGIEQALHIVALCGQQFLHMHPLHHLSKLVTENFERSNGFATETDILLADQVETGQRAALDLDRQYQQCLDTFSGQQRVMHQCRIGTVFTHFAATALHVPIAYQRCLPAIGRNTTRLAHESGAQTAIGDQGVTAVVL